MWIVCRTASVSQEPLSEPFRDVYLYLLGPVWKNVCASLDNEMEGYRSLGGTVKLGSFYILNHTSSPFRLPVAGRLQVLGLCRTVQTPPVPQACRDVLRFSPNFLIRYTVANVHIFT